jgi:hypothetical protein
LQYGARYQLYLESCKFFYATLKSRDKVKLKKLYAELGGQTRQILSEAVELIYFMKGSLSYHEVMEMTLLEKQIVAEFIEKQLNAQKKNPLLKFLG